MKHKKDIGILGEKCAREYLLQSGYEIVATNWRYKRAEIDIIAKDGDTLVFAEVKTRSYNYYGEPEESVTAEKEALMIDAAQRFMEESGHNWEIRFDILAVIITKEGKLTKISHFKDAFFY